MIDLDLLHVKRLQQGEAAAGERRIRETCAGPSKRDSPHSGLQQPIILIGEETLTMKGNGLTTL
jgi:hypothetical protein